MKKFHFSKKTHLSGTIAALLLFSGFSLSAQQMFTEHTSGTVDGSITNERHFDEQSYTKILDENGNKVFLKNQAPAENTPQGANATNDDIALSINLVFDESQFYVSSVLIFDESDYMHVANWNGTNPIVVSVPDGTYDIVTEFQPLNSSKSHIVIKEQQSIQGNTTLQLNTSDAVNYVTITTYDENGEVLEPESGVGGSISFDRYLYFNPKDFAVIGDNYSANDPLGGQDPAWNFYISDVSNRYSIIQALIGVGFDQGNYYNKFETLSGIEGPVAVQNDPADWSYHTEMFQPTQLASSTVAPAYFAASTFNGHLLFGWRVSAGGSINPGDEPFRGFLNNPLDGDPADLLVIPAIVDKTVMINPTMGATFYFTKGNSAFSDGNGGVLYGSGDVSSNSHSILLDDIPYLGDDYYLLDNGETKLLPAHPRFTFDDTTTPSVTLGDNVPITVTGFEMNPNSFKAINKGRYGETRESDYLATQILVEQNETVIYSGTYEDFESFILPSTGQFEIALTNANTSVEGLEGTNTTTITYGAERGDAPPTLQHLQFRDSEDRVTDVFDSAEGATVRLAAGDFEYTMIDGSTGYYAYEEGNTVTLSYSIYNQNDWTELALTEYPEYFQAQAFGDYYEASLDGVGTEAGNVWYDVKVMCTDAGGNTQEQVISPAFKIAGPLGVQELAESNISVYPNPFSDRINLVLPEEVKGNYTFSVTDLTGRTVYTNTQSDKSFSWNTSFLSEGVYIISIENNGTITAKKMIKL